MLAKQWAVCADPDCEFDIEPGDIVEVQAGQLVHQGCEAHT